MPERQAPAASKTPEMVGMKGGDPDVPLHQEGFASQAGAFEGGPTPERAWAGDGQDLVHKSSAPALAVSARGRIAAWNEGAQTLLGYSVEEVRGRPCWSVLRGTTPAGEPLCTPACAALACFHRGQPFSAPEVLLCSKDGRMVPVTFDTLLLPGGNAQNARTAIALVFLQPQASPPPAGQPPLLRLFCLGPFRILLGAQEVQWQAWRRKLAVTLLAFLAHHRGRPVHRDVIIEALWPETPEKAARERLKVVVYSLRRQLGREAGGAIVRQGSFYALDPALLWLDVAVFEELLGRGVRQVSRQETDEALATLETAQAFYRGDYLEAELYSEWAQMERARLAERYLELLHAAGLLYAREGRYREAIGLYRLALCQDPCREETHRLLARALMALGEQAEALRQLQRCEEALRAQLGLPPSAETLALRDALQAGHAPGL